MQKAKEILKDLWIPLVVIVAVLVVDLVTKAAIEKTIPLSTSKTLIPNFLYFTYEHNDGAAFSMFKGAQTFFKIMTPFALAGFGFFMYKSRKSSIVLRVCLGMIISGALGNYIDRLMFSYVRDFIHVHFFGLDLPLLGTDFAIFNIADSSLTIGVAVFAVYYIFLHKEPEAQKLAQRKKEEKRLDQKHSLSVEEYLAQKKSPSLTDENTANE